MACLDAPAGGPIRGVRAAAAIAIWGLLASGCDTTLYEGVTSEVAERACARLVAAGVSCRRVRRGGAWEVSIPVGQVAQAVHLLDACEPAPQPDFDSVYGQPGPIPTPAEETARRAHATAGALARTLSAMTGIDAARVHLPMAPRPSAGGFGAPTAPVSPPRALVWLRPVPGHRPDAAQIARMVAAAAPPLLPEQIVVTLDPPARAQARPGPPLVRLGPIRVSAGSLPALRLFGGLSLLLNGALAVLLGILWRRARVSR